MASCQHALTTLRACAHLRRSSSTLRTTLREPAVGALVCGPLEHRPGSCPTGAGLLPRRRPTRTRRLHQSSRDGRAPSSSSSSTPATAPRALPILTDAAGTSGSGIGSGSGSGGGGDRVRREGLTFRGQLQESITQRVAHQAAERQRFAEQRDEAAKDGARTVAITVCESSPTSCEATCAGAWLIEGSACIAFCVVGFLLGQYSMPKLPNTSTLPLGSRKPPQHNTGTGNLEAAWTDLANIVGREHVTTDVHDRESHAGSEWSTHLRSTDAASREAERPFMVVYPCSTDEVSRIMKVCHQRKIGVVPYAGGTSLEGHYAHNPGDICIDFSRMSRIVRLNKEDMDVVVQPGVGWEDLNATLSDEGLFFPPDPGPGAKIGGMIGTGCSGTNSFRYGTMREWVLSVTAVLADGTVITTRQRPRKSSAGYDLTKLFVGSEGTLGLVTEATLKLAAKPISSSVAVCGFDSIRHAADAVGRIVQAGVDVAAIEVLDANMMLAINTAGSTGRKWAERPTLFFKFAGADAGVREQIALAKKLAAAAGSRTFEFARTPAESEELWSARKDALWSVMGMARGVASNSLSTKGDIVALPSATPASPPPADDHHVWTTDVAVPLSRLPELIEATQRDLAEQGLFAGIVGHVGDGNFHAIIAYRGGSGSGSGGEQRRRVEGVVGRLTRRALELEGTTTGEHGVGLVKRDYLPRELGQDAVDAMRMIKLSLDPLCLLNCGKVMRITKPAKGEEVSST